MLLILSPKYNPSPHFLCHHPSPRYFFFFPRLLQLPPLVSLLQLLPMEEQISAFLRVSLVAQAVKNLPAKQETQVGSLDLIAGSGRSPGEGNGNSLQYSCLGNPMDREAWQAKVCGVAKSQTRLSTPRRWWYIICVCVYFSFSLLIYM